MACDAGDVGDAAWLFVRQEVGDCELRYADGVRDVDVYEGVAGGGRVVSRGRCAGWVPEVRPWLW